MWTNFSGNSDEPPAIGMGCVPTEFAKAGTVIDLEARAKRALAVIIAKPIYRKTPPT